MAQLAQVWTVSVWTAVATFHVLHALEFQYPALGTFHTISCECKDRTCQAVHWFRKLHNGQNEMEFLLYYNNANKDVYADNKLKDLFKGDLKGSWKITYNLKIISVKKEDAGLYFCLLQYNNRVEPGSYGVDLQPGKTPPTSPSVVTKKPKQPCRCHTQKKAEKKECSRRVLWSLVGVLLSLVVVLLSTLYYFSRLPKKCRHRFAKKQQLT